MQCFECLYLYSLITSHSVRFTKPWPPHTNWVSNLGHPSQNLLDTPLHSMRFFWRACVVYAFYGFVSVAWCCDPTFLASPHGLSIVGYLYWFFRHVWCLVLCFGALALLALPVPAQILTVPWCRVAEVAVFFYPPSTSFGAIASF